MGYRTIRNEGSSEFTEKKSVFIGSGRRVETEEEARAFIDKVKSTYKEARHHVYAYTLGENENIQRYSDDGEPQGTGGMPVLDVIRKSGLKNSVIVVTRYFGGVLLGASGLTRAYIRGASDAIGACGTIERVYGNELKLSIAYDLLGKFQHLLRENGIHIEDTSYAEDVEITLYIEEGRTAWLIAQLTEAASGRLGFITGDRSLYYKENDRLFTDIV
ncbi:YigZ family protein [Youngiibacter fragilis]|uniref:YigZ family protein n=1 Tax=Youngiibacter fragilis 232.1 TaxID=994573 RepID=V7I258_9CLOT|nr:YigZ family protein [Youngiibacter fragilis]ETA80325.1 hypothetical protein T472_0212255 [Youngiibacter fragilis 232.1]